VRTNCPPSIAGPSSAFQAGNVNSGAFDPAGRDLQPRAGAQPVHGFHVDGAFGLWAAASAAVSPFSPRVSARADSWATDGHKWPNVGYDCGNRIRTRSSRAFSQRWRSLRPTCPRATIVSLHNSRPEIVTPRARGVEPLGGRLRSLGRAGLSDLIETDVQSCEEIRRRAFAILSAKC